MFKNPHCIPIMLTYFFNLFIFIEDDASFL